MWILSMKQDDSMTEKKNKKKRPHEVSSVLRRTSLDRDKKHVSNIRIKKVSLSVSQCLYIPFISKMALPGTSLPS